MKKIQKQGRNQKRMKTTLYAQKIERCKIAFLHLFISNLFLYVFKVHPYLKCSFGEYFIP